MRGRVAPLVAALVAAHAIAACVAFCPESPAAPQQAKYSRRVFCGAKGFGVKATKKRATLPPPLPQRAAAEPPAGAALVAQATARSTARGSSRLPQGWLDTVQSSAKAAKELEMERLEADVVARGVAEEALMEATATPLDALFSIAPSDPAAAAAAAPLLASTLRSDGVVRLDGCLAPSTAAELRRYVDAALGAPDARFANVLLNANRRGALGGGRVTTNPMLVVRIRVRARRSELRRVSAPPPPPSCRVCASARPSTTPDRALARPAAAARGHGGRHRPARARRAAPRARRQLLYRGEAAQS